MFQWVVFSFDVTTLNLAISVYFQEAIFFSQDFPSKPPSLQEQCKYGKQVEKENNRSEIRHENSAIDAAC